jgi:hypothetical protein
LRVKAYAHGQAAGLTLALVASFMLASGDAAAKLLTAR